MLPLLLLVVNWHGWMPREVTWPGVVPAVQQAVCRKSRLLVSNRRPLTNRVWRHPCNALGRCCSALGPIWKTLYRYDVLLLCSALSICGVVSQSVGHCPIALALPSKALD